jgi:DNA-binding MarR family transcriptional regulator
MSSMDVPLGHGSLSVLLSQALVAFTIEMDDEAERRLPHSTSRHGIKTSDGQEEREGEAQPTPWLTSFAMYANTLQYVDEEGTTVARLVERARTSRLQLGGLRRWGYVTVRPPAGQLLRTPPQPESLVRLRSGGRRACTVWTTMPGVVEGRWRARFGDAAVDAVRRELAGLLDALPFDTPDYLPIVFPTQNGMAERLPPKARTIASMRRTAEPGTARTAGRTRKERHADLSALLSGVLLGFSLDFEAEARISMPIGSNTLRVLRPKKEQRNDQERWVGQEQEQEQEQEHEQEHDLIRVRDLPRLTGVSKEANAMCIGWLERHGCAEVVADPSGGRGKVVRLTAKGRGAQTKHRRLLDSTEARWRDTYGERSVGRLVDALAPIVGDGTLASSPLAAGLEPSVGNWRAAVRRPEILPYYPMVLHRGGYPDGS